LVGWDAKHSQTPILVALFIVLAINLVARIFVYWKRLRNVPHLMKHDDWPEAFKNSKVSLISPAYNEEAGIESTIRAALGSTMAGPSNFEMIVVDDQSKDNTYEAMCRVDDERLKPIAGAPRKNTHLDWKGKNWACYQGYKEAQGDVLIFMDSDITFLPGAIESLLHGLCESGADWLTCTPCHYGVSC